jgi:hypothetical protein
MCKHEHTVVQLEGLTTFAGEVFDDIREAVYCMDCNSEVEKEGETTDTTDTE